LTGFRDSLILNPIQPIPRPEEKAAVPRLQLRRHPSEYASKRRAGGSQARGSESSSARTIKDELAKVAAAWDRVQKTRVRDAIYDYLEAVRTLVHDNWERRGRPDRKARQALRTSGLKAPKHPEPYAAVIACTSTADIKARSKWARALQYVVSCPPKDEALMDYMKRHGGINGCASRFARRLGRRRK